MNEKNAKMLTELTEVPASKDMQRLILDMTNIRVKFHNFIESINDRRLYNEIEENYPNIDKDIASLLSLFICISSMHTEYAMKNHFEPKNI